MKNILYTIITCGLIISLLFSSVGFAQSTSYDYVIECIEKVRFNNKPLFVNGERFIANKSDPNLFFTPKGITFFWTYDTRKGFVWFFENGTDIAYEWDIDIEEPIMAGTLVTNILTVDAKNYIDYEDGGKISFVLTSSMDFTNPVAIIEYSPCFTEATNTDNYACEYSDYSAFCIAVNWWFANVIFNGSTREEYENIINSAMKGTDTYETLSIGSKGEAVVQLQTKLNELGYTVGTVDGDYGNKTKVAIETFQKDRGIEVTGIADIETQKALFENVENSIPETTMTPATTPVQKETTEITTYSESECKEIAIAYMKEHIQPNLKNPASLQIISISGGMTGTEYLFTISFSAMNSMGGYTPGTYYCKVDYTTGKVTMGGMI